jgi:hypothetical protein
LTDGERRCLEAHLDHRLDNSGERGPHVPATRDDEGRWVGGGVTQWVEEPTFALLEHGVAAFVYLLPPGDSISDTALNLWAHEVVPAVRDPIANR